MSKDIQIGLLGSGTVGTGVLQIIKDHQKDLAHQVGSGIKVKKVLVRDMNKYQYIENADQLLTDRVEDILEDEEIKVVIEVMGGIDEAKDYIIRALKNKKNVVTANKDLIALHGAELVKIAAENSCDLFYEASVAGGIPIIRGLTEGLSSDRISQMMGIVNGTTNYILTKMSQDGRAYDDVLAEAQALGFAESDPTSDVEGLDAARKMAILASLGFSMDVELEDVDVRGITTVTIDDIKYAEQMGYALKLIGLAKRDGERIELTVQPMLLPAKHPLSSVHDEYNAVYVYGDAIGETMFYGPGAGSLPTATAIVSDLVTVVKNMKLGVSGRSIVPPLYHKQLKTHDEVQSKYFIRLHVKDETGTFAALTSVFAKENVSFEKLMQWPIEHQIAEVAVITHTTTKSVYERIFAELEKMDVVVAVKSSYRVEGGNAE